MTFRASRRHQPPSPRGRPVRAAHLAHPVRHSTHSASGDLWQVERREWHRIITHLNSARPFGSRTDPDVAPARRGIVDEQFGIAGPQLGPFMPHKSASPSPKQTPTPSVSTNRLDSSPPAATKPTAKCGPSFARFSRSRPLRMPGLCGCAGWAAMRRECSISIRFGLRVPDNHAA